MVDDDPRDAEDVDIRQLRQMLRLMKQYGVTHLKSGDVEVLMPPSDESYPGQDPLVPLEARDIERPERPRVDRDLFTDG